MMAALRILAVVAGSSIAGGRLGNLVSGSPAGTLAGAVACGLLGVAFAAWELLTPPKRKGAK